MENSIRPLKIAIHGMDSRAVKTMMLFLQGPCRGVAYVVVNAEDADLDIFDGDLPDSKKLVEQFTLENKQKPALVVSLQDFAAEGILCLKKPIKASEMLLALEQAKTTIDKLSKTPADGAASPAAGITMDAHAGQGTEAKGNGVKPSVSNLPERNKTSKHQTALLLDERSFHKNFDTFKDFDINDPTQAIAASYNPKNFFQGFFQAALTVAKSNKQIMLLESNWLPITLFPRTQEIWLDAGDQELKGFAGIKLNRKIMEAELFLSRVDPEMVTLDKALDKFQSIENFLWKLTCWTSNGHYPQDIDYRFPVYLKNWPNFTRLLVTPHALRISALLIKGPRTMDNIARALNIKIQYVFMFVSAAHAIGLAGQVKRLADSLVEAPEIKHSAYHRVLKHLASKLRSR
ncbi:hypothetical protein [Methyloglobulus morosus]|nr:hypothetical protein [Methyloglobulus morosus]